MGHAVPDGSDVYLLNVYLGNSGAGAPTINFDGAYASIDGQGYPYIVLSPSVASYFDMGPEYEPYAATTAVHELYHTVQFATGSFLADDAYWFWEATADWVAGEIYPQHESSYAFVGAWALYPHVAIDFADYADEGLLIELHQYGASIFPQYLTDVAGDWQIVRDAWVNGGANGDPLETLDTGLAALGTDVREAFADFAARLPVWDYPRGEVYEMWAEYYGDAYADEDFRIATSVGPDGTGWKRAPALTEPAAFGINVIELSPVNKTITVSVKADAEGSQGSPASMRAFISWRAGSSKSFQELTFEGLEGSIELDASEADDIYLVVTPLPDSDQGVDETFGYRYKVNTGSGGGDEPYWSCSVQALDGPASVAWLALLPGLALVLRRRAKFART
jgi:hypothetical protein